MAAPEGKGGSSRRRSSSSPARTTRRSTRASGGRRIKVPDRAKGPPWDVAFHPDADKELAQLKAGDPDGHLAVMTVIEKLKVTGPMLRFPHQSGVKGEGGEGLRELRPTSGRTLIRPLFRRFKNIYVILAIGPEAQVDPAGFAKALKRAQRRRGEMSE